MAAVVTMKQLLEAGVHFGHQTRRWNPKMKRFIYGERNGIYIIDLQQTLKRIETAYVFVRDLVANGGTLLFIGTKKQAQDPIADAAASCGMPYINERWLGGMLTNFTTMSARVKKMQELQRMRAVGDFDAMPKKEHIGVTEANKLKVPVVAVVDTNCDPDLVDYVIPGNDDAIRAGTLMCRVISDAVKEGRFIAERRGTAKPVPPPPTPEQEAERARQQAAAQEAAARQRDEREARLAAASARTLEGSAEETEAVVPSQASPEMGQEPGGVPVPPVQAPPSDAVEPNPGAIPTRDDDLAVAAQFPQTQPGSAGRVPVGSHGGQQTEAWTEGARPVDPPGTAGATADDLAPPPSSEPDGAMPAQSPTEE